MSLRILIAHSLPGQRGTQTALYIGSSGAELESAKASAGPTVGSFSIINNPPAVRKSNPVYDPSTKPAAVATSGSVTSPEIPADIQKLKKPELISALAGAVAQIEQLEAELKRVHASNLEAAEALAAQAAQALQGPALDTDAESPGDPDAS